MNKNNLFELIFFLIIIIGISIRFINLRYNTIFSWDQEYSIAYAARDIVVNHHFPLISVLTGRGNLYLGPLYSYLSASLYYILKMDPVSGAVLAGILSTTVIILSFFLAKKNFNKNIAVIYTSIYSISAFIISIDRVPWYVNLFALSAALIFFGLLTIKKFELRGFILVGLGLFLGINGHYSVIFLILIVLLFFLFIYRQVNRYLFIPLSSLLIGILPLILFELRHNFLLFNNIQAFSKISFIDFSKLFYSSISILSLILTSGGKVILYDGTNWSQSGLTLLLITSLYLLSKRADISTYLKISLLYFIIYIFGLTLYSGIVSEYYLVGLLPVFILGYAVVIDNLVQSNKNYQLILILFFTISVLHSYSIVKQNTPFSLGYKQQVIQYIKNKYANNPVKFVFDMNLSESFGFNYLLDYYKVNKSDADNSPKIWISYPVDRFPGKPDILIGDYAISTGENVMKIYSTKTVSFYNGLFNMRVPRNLNILECPYTDMDSYILDKDTESSCSRLPNPKSGITIYNLPNCNIWEMSNLKPLDVGINIPFYVISSKNIPNTLSLNNYIVVTAFERNRCIIFNDLSDNQENFSKQFLEIIDSARKK